MKTTLSLIVAALLMVSCNGRNNENNANSTDNALATSAEDAVTTLSAILDDESNEAYATSHQKSIDEILQDLVMPKAYAAGCIRPVVKACNNGQKSSDFSDCTGYLGFVVATGNITLDYSENDCSMASVGNNVQRTYNYNLSLPSGANLEVTSDDREDYRGNVIGGGAVLTKEASGWTLDVLGKHKIRSRNGDVTRDRSLRTTEPLEISGGLRRGQRQLNNGQLEIIHNPTDFSRHNGFTATYTAEDLEWDSSCCHPVSGTLSVEYTGIETRSASITFNSCGEAEILKNNGETTNVEFSYCE